MAPRGRRPIRRRDEAGVTLVEMMVALVLMAAVVPVVAPLMTSGATAAIRIESESRTIDELRGQLFAIQRELRSAVCILAPAAGPSNAGPVLTFTTAANGTPYEVSYEVTGGRLTRTVAGATNEVGTGVSEGVFEHIANPRRSIRIRLVVAASASTTPKELVTIVAGRNAWETSC